MLPLSDVIPSRTPPITTIVLIGLTVVVFLLELAPDTATLRELTATYGVTPADFWWPTLVTSQFLHAGWIHLGANLLFLWIFGSNVEDAFGHAWFLAFYLGCGAVAAAVQVLAHGWSSAPMIGASGAVAGVLGAYLVLYPRSRVLTAMFAILYLDIVEVPALFFLGLWFLLQLFSGVAGIGTGAADGAMAFWAHISGFTAGAACGAYSRFAARSLRRYWNS
jgi:membrane associated rhomboid family serine protease